MPKLAISVPHDLGEDEARNRIKGFVKTFVREKGQPVSDISESWVDHTACFSFRIMGFFIEGSLHVEESCVRLEGSFPLAALPFKKGVERDIRDMAKKMIG